MLKFLPALLELAGIAAVLLLIIFGGRWAWRRFTYGPSENPVDPQDKGPQSRNDRRDGGKRSS